MPARAAQLQIRVTAAQKRRLRRLAAAAGQDMSSYVLGRVLPEQAVAFAALIARLRDTDEPSYVFAALSDFLSTLAPIDFAAATESADVARLLPFASNYLAAMVEHAARLRRLVPPSWTRDVPPLATPYFATTLRSLRLHLLLAAPVAYKRRNLFVDSVVGDQV